MASTREDIDAELAKLENGGKSIEELAQLEDGDGQQFLDFGDKLDLKVGGMKPTESAIKIKAISRPVKGQLGDLEDDQVITVLVTARLDDLNIVTKRDGDGHAIAKVRRHVLTPVSVYPVTPDQADQILGLS